jgi:hypothetical protein
MNHPATIDGASLSELRRAYGQKNLTLYVGTGASLASGLPSWGDDTKVSELSGSREPKLDNLRRLA